MADQGNNTKRDTDTLAHADGLREAGSFEHGGGVVNLYKNLGETPRERLERLRVQKAHYAHEVLSYAGRLDPMAEGVLLCLVGAANKRREQYLDLSKEYVLDILFGFSTDTYDVLGRVMDTGDPSSVRKRAIEKGLNEFRGHVAQEYPPFSSKTVGGKSLFEWARGNALSALVLPERSVLVYDIMLEGIYKIKEPELFSYIEAGVDKVQGDFRQEEIMRLWKRSLKPSGEREFPCATVRVACSSGTYMRSIAHALGKELGVPALALHILRTKVGDYDVKQSLK
jgi:tRNA pseudouridine55 synthase